MTLTYGLRLFCLLTVLVGVVYAAVQVALSCGSRYMMRRLDRVGSRHRERILYLLQVAPALLAILVAGLLCFPEYLRHEPAHAAEPVGWITLLLAVLVCVWFGSALLRGLRTALRTIGFARNCRRFGRLMGGSGSAPILALAGAAPPLSLVGFLRPSIVISESLVETGGLNPEALQVALDHELAHARQLDNCKLLSFCFLPRLIGDPWRQAWQLAADCAADDDAAAGDPARSMLLAEALVRAARLVRPSRSTVICAALTRAEAGLAHRIDRLLSPRRAPQSAGKSLLTGFAGMVLLAVGAAAASSPWVYGLCEYILHLGGF